MNTRKVKELRTRLADAQGWLCFYCNDPMTERTVTMDELIPRSLGGPRTLENAVAACEDCNARRGTIPWQTFKLFFCKQREHA